MPEQPRPETNPQESGHTSENDLARLLQESSAETDRSAANLLADTLHQSIEERRGIMLSAEHSAPSSMRRPTLKLMLKSSAIMRRDRTSTKRLLNWTPKKSGL